MKPRAIGIGCGGLFVLLVLLFFVGEIAAEVPFWLAVGWIWFLRRVLPAVHGSVEATVTALAAAAVLGTGAHLALVRLRRHLRQDAASQDPWRPRWTALLLGLIVAALLCSMASIGVAHQVGWLFTGGRITYTERDFVEALEAPQLACRSFAIAEGSFDERLRSFWPLRDSHDVLADERTGEALLIPRDPDRLRRRGLSRCERNGRLEHEASSIEEVLERWRTTPVSPAGVGTPGGGADAGPEP